MAGPDQRSRRLVGGLSTLVAQQGTVGVVVLLVLLAAACGVIYAFSRQHRVDHENVTDSAEVMVLASASSRSYPTGRKDGDDQGSPSSRTGAGSR